MSNKLFWICLIKASSRLDWARMKHMYMWHVLIYFTESLVYITYHTFWLLHKLRVRDGATWNYILTGEIKKIKSGYITRSKGGSLQMCLHTLPASASASRRYMAFPFSQLKNSSLVGESCSGANLTKLWEEVCQIQCEFQLLFSNLYSNFGKAGRVKTNPLATCLWAASRSPWTHIAMCLRMFVCVTARQQLPLWKMHRDRLQKSVCLTY